MGQGKRRLRAGGPGQWHFQARVPAALAMVVFLRIAAHAQAQQSVPATAAAPSAASAAIPSATTHSPTISLPVRRASFGHVWVSTLLGGAAGGALGTVLGAATTSDPFGHDLALGVGGVAGYVVGSSIGAWKGAAVGTAHPAFGEVFFISTAAAAGGGWLWNRISSSGRFTGTTVTGSTAWCLGGLAGVAVQTLLTSAFARATVRLKPAPTPPELGGPMTPDTTSVIAH